MKKKKNKDVYGVNFYKKLASALEKNWDRFSGKNDKTVPIDERERFEYPYYCGIPYNISGELCGDVVDHLQELQDFVFDGHLKKKAFFNELRERMFLLSRR